LGSHLQQIVLRVTSYSFLLFVPLKSKIDSSVRMFFLSIVQRKIFVHKTCDDSFQNVQ
jgi:hypothetical protein